MGVYGNYIIEGIFGSKDPDSKRIKEAKKLYNKKLYKEAFGSLKYVKVNSENSEDVVNILSSYGNQLSKSNNRTEIAEFVDWWGKHYFSFDKSSQSKIDKIVKTLKERSTNLRKNQSGIMSDEDKKEIKKILASIVKKYQIDDNTRLELAKYKATLCCKVFEEYEFGISFIICDDSQDVRINISSIISSIADELEEIINDKLKHSYSVNTGDGDEGCIYIER